MIKPILIESAYLFNEQLKDEFSELILDEEGNEIFITIKVTIVHNKDSFSLEFIGRALELKQYGDESTYENHLFNRQIAMLKEAQAFAKEQLAKAKK